MYLPADLLGTAELGFGFNLYKANIAASEDDDFTCLCGPCGEAPIDCQCEQFVCSGGYIKMLDLIEWEEGDGQEVIQ